MKVKVPKTDCVATTHFFPQPNQVPPSSLSTDICNDENINENMIPSKPTKPSEGPLDIRKKTDL